MKMKIAERVDAWRAVQDASYTAQLSTDQWQELIGSPEWSELQQEFPDLAGRFIAAHEGELARYFPSPAEGNGSNPSLAPAPLTILGKDQTFVQWLSIYNGTAKYTENMAVPNMLFVKALRSPYPHATIKAIDASKAEKLPGVVKVLHRFNQPTEYQDSAFPQFGWIPGPPTFVMFPERATHVGAQVAVVAAESEHIADEAIHLIDVQYEVLPAVLDYMEGTRPATQKQWDNKLDGTILNVARPLVRGDPDSGFGQAEVVVDGITTRSTEQNAPLELTSGIFQWENGRLYINWLMRYPHAQRDRMARALKIPATQVKVIQTGYVGSSYGSHRDFGTTELAAAILAKLTGRPVKATMSRSEDFLVRTHRAAARVESKLGLKRDGTFVSASFKVIHDSGADASTWATGAWIGLQTLYTIPNLRLEATDVWTNSFRSGTYRCVDHPLGTWAQETLVEKAAYAVGMSPLDIRLKNLNTSGNPDNKRPYSNPGSRDCLTKVAERIGWSQKWHPPKAKEVRPGVFHGMALSAHSCSHGAGGPPSTAMVVVHTNGTLTVQSAAAEIGCGQRTLMAMIAAETLGIPYEQTSIAMEVDTDVTPDTGITAGSRMTNSGGWGVFEAAMDAKRQLLEGAAKKLTADAKGLPPDTKLSAADVDIQNGVVSAKAYPEAKMTVAEAVATVLPGTPVIGRGAHFHEPTWERLAWAAHAAEVEVDIGTGTVTVLRYVAAHDVGRALNPKAVEQQIQGGVVMGLGAALTEELLVDKATGRPITDNILEYKMLSIRDVPREIEVIMVENPKAYGVYGAHGIGEPPLALPPPTIANAVYNAIGVWVESLPITRDKILAGLKKA
jgi:xanthine dehydrogenase molybdenum-binding subunit